MAKSENTGGKQAADLLASALRRGGKFAPGASGNPAGRPAGSRNKTTLMCEQLLGDDAELIMKRLVKQAKAGKETALRLCVERLVPTRAARDRTVALELPDVAKAGDIAAAAASVIQHAASGAITLSEAKDFLQLLELQRRTIETVELQIRLEVVEAQLGVDVPKPMGFAAENLGARVRRLPDDEN